MTKSLRQPVSLAIVVLVLLAAWWLGSSRESTAQMQVPIGPNTPIRYTLQPAADGTMFLLDTWGGDTWVLTPRTATADTLHQWAKLKRPEGASVLDRGMK